MADWVMVLKCVASPWWSVKRKTKADYSSTQCRTYKRTYKNYSIYTRSPAEQVCWQSALLWLIIRCGHFQSTAGRKDGTAEWISLWVWSVACLLRDWMTGFGKYLSLCVFEFFVWKLLRVSLSEKLQLSSVYCCCSLGFNTTKGTENRGAKI